MSNKMKNIVFISLLLLSALTGWNQDEDKTNFNSDSIFKDISTDSLHISLCTFGEFKDSDKLDKTFQWKGPLISDSLKQEMRLDPDVSYALGKIILNTEKNIIGYIVGCVDLKVQLYAYSFKQKDFIFNIQLASYKYVEAAYEKTRNSWIIDQNGDGNLDIATWEKLTDFEFQNQLSDNLSGDKKFIHFLIDGNFKHEDWTNFDSKQMTLTK